MLRGFVRRGAEAAARARSVVCSRAWAPNARPASTGAATTTTNNNGSASETLRDESIMDHLVCPISKYPLRYDAARRLIICPEIRVAYPIRDGVPVLVPSEGRVLRDDEDV